MSVSCGFYNSKDGDRLYNAIQLSSIFDGIIKDGIFMSIGDCLTVKASGEGMTLLIGEGRAWFNHSWTFVDAPEPIRLDMSEVIHDRIDTIVLNVDSSLAVRDNTFAVVKGTPAVADPQPPELIRSNEINQYALCDILVKKGVTEITQTDITNRVGMADTPFVTGILETMDIEALVMQWQANWSEWVAGQGQAFANWFTDLQIELSGNVAGNLQTQIDIFNYSLMGFVETETSFTKGAIVTKYNSGYSQVVEFAGNEMITTYRSDHGTVLRTLTTIFSSDGVIRSTLSPADSAIPPIHSGNFTYSGLAGLPTIGGTTIVGDLQLQDIGAQPIMSPITDSEVDAIVDGGM